MPTDPARARALCLAALDLLGPSARRTWLDRQCGDEAELRALVEGLLADHDRNPGEAPGPDPGLEGFIDAPAWFLKDEAPEPTSHRRRDGPSA